MQGQFHKPAERLGAIATSRAKVAERLKPLKALCDYMYMYMYMYM